MVGEKSSELPSICMPNTNAVARIAVSIPMTIRKFLMVLLLVRKRRLAKVKNISPSHRSNELSNRGADDVLSHIILKSGRNV